MKPQDWERCKQIFCDALELGLEERILLVERECSGEPELRLQVLEMLGSATDDSSLLDINAAEQVVGSPRLAQPLIPGDILGRYRVLRPIGQGGTSLVYLAEHVGLHSPRRFAIKVIASAFLGGQFDRFDRECEILAGLEHPNIARIIDQGVTETGWPYLVMDFIDGLPIQEYCAAKKLAPPEIVRLLLDCCGAVSYVHSKLVVHCDLKPTNILVDAGGSPLILDFGISRLIEPDRKTRAGGTTRGIRPLSPNYASPEQLVGAPLTASTDIYSLGVVFYESLAGTLPFEHAEYPWPQLSRNIAEREVPPPSKARLKRGAGREKLAFARQLQGDLDSIVLKTLAADPRDRYASIDELSADLNRYLNGEVVQARRSTWGVRAGKLLRRRRRQLVQAAWVCGGIGLALGASSWFATRQSRDRDLAHVEELKAIITPLIHMLPEELPVSVRARTSLAEHLSQNIESVAPRISQYPELRADLADALLRNAELLGDPYGASLGRIEEARVYYRRALDLVHNTANAASAAIRARACLGMGDTYSHPSLERDPVEAANWYQRALHETAGLPELRASAALAQSRMGMIDELLGDAGGAQSRYEQALRLPPAEDTAFTPLTAAINLIHHAGMEPPAARRGTYAKALEKLQVPLRYDFTNILTWHTAIEAHLALGMAEFNEARMAEAEKEFSSAGDLAATLLSQDSEDLQMRRESAMALQRRSLIPSRDGRRVSPNSLRDQAVEALKLTIPNRPDSNPDAHANSSCGEASERISEGTSVTPLMAGDLVIANRGSPDASGNLLAFSPGSLEMSVLAKRGYLNQIVDVAIASRTELYVADRNFAGSGAIVRLRHEAGRWLQKPVSCGGLLRHPGTLAYAGGRLLLADDDESSAVFIGIDPATGRQTLLGRTGAPGKPGKLVHSVADDFLLSLFWPGEGGPAELVRFNAGTRKLDSAARFGLLGDPVAVALAPNGDLIVADREWVGARGLGSILRIGHGGAGSSQKLICQTPELSRVTAVAVASERESWFTTASVPYSDSPAARAKLFHLDLASGHASEVTISEGILSAPVALLRAK